MKDINNSDMEKMLLTGKSLDELIQMKIQEDYTPNYITYQRQYIP